MIKTIPTDNEAQTLAMRFAALSLQADRVREQLKAYADPDEGAKERDRVPCNCGSQPVWEYTPGGISLTCDDCADGETDYDGWIVSVVRSHGKTVADCRTTWDKERKSEAAEKAAEKAAPLLRKDYHAGDNTAKV